MFGSDNENFRTIESRLVNWEMALDMGITNPIFGVGSGNYFDYVDSSLKRGMTIFKEIEREFNYGITDPHNILVKTFAETGLVGISGLIVLLAFFVSKDITILKSKNTFLKLLVIGFWTVFIYSMANPGYTVKYLMNYWMFRLMIQAEVSI
jgi:O-antigen ligase